MAKGRIAILEDDVTLANAMKAACERAGYEVFASSRNEEIEEYLQKSPVNTLFVDCLLPGGSGVDFALQIRKTFPAEILDIVMMSGLFTDSGFMKETARSVQAISSIARWRRVGFTRRCALVGASQFIGSRVRSARF